MPTATARLTWKRTADVSYTHLDVYKRQIYDAINDVTDAMKGMLAPKYREVELGRAERCV